MALETGIQLCHCLARMIRHPLGWVIEPEIIHHAGILRTSPAGKQAKANKEDQPKGTLKERCPGEGKVGSVAHLDFDDKA